MKKILVAAAFILAFSIITEAQTPVSLAWDASLDAASGLVKTYMVKYTGSCATFSGTICTVPAYPSVWYLDVGNALSYTLQMPVGKWYVYVVAVTSDPNVTSDPSNILTVDVAVPVTKPRPPGNVRKP